jgi:predicted transcriptional regulator
MEGSLLSSYSYEYLGKIFKYSFELLGMVFAVSAAKERILQKLAEQDWSPTDLAEELGKSPETIYNHLHDLEEQGVLSTRQVAAKTRPKTEYSIGNGLIQYVAVLPGQYQQGALDRGDNDFSADAYLEAIRDDAEAEPATPTR